MRNARVTSSSRRAPASQENLHINTLLEISALLGHFALYCCDCEKEGISMGLARRLLTSVSVTKENSLRAVMFLSFFLSFYPITSRMYRSILWILLPIALVLAESVSSKSPISLPLQIALSSPASIGDSYTTVILSGSQALQASRKCPCCLSL